MTNTNPTTTAQATVLTDEQIDLLSRVYSGPKWEYQTSIPSLIASHRVLTEQVRVLADALRKCDELDTIDEGYGEIAEIARSALAALEGSGASE